MDPKFKELLKTHPGYTDALRAKYIDRLKEAVHSKSAFDVLASELKNYNRMVDVSPKEYKRLVAKAQALDDAMVEERKLNEKMNLIDSSMPLLPGPPRKERCNLEGSLYHSSFKYPR